MSNPEPDLRSMAHALELAYRKFVLRDDRLYTADVSNRMETEIRNAFSDEHLEEIIEEHAAHAGI